MAFLALGLVLVGFALLIVVDDPFGAGKPSGSSSKANQTSLVTVRRQALSSQTQVSATLGYAGAANIRLPTGTPAAAVQQAEQAVKNSERMLDGARASLATGSSTLANMRATVAAARAKEALDCAGRLPVLACLGAADDGQVLNINADVVASQLATAVGSGALVACTAVGGVRRDKDDPASRIPRLTVAEAREAIRSGAVQGGMIPKLEEAFVPLAAGVGAVHIVAPADIAAALDTPGSAGTLLVP